MFRPHRLALSAGLAAALSAAPALADHHEGGDHAAETKAGVVPDRQILGLLTPMNRAEIEVSRFAAERAVTPDVKDFARKMTEAHEELGKELARAARRADAHGTLTRRERRRAEQPLRDDGAVTGEEREEVLEEIEEGREELAEEREEVREGVREERDDSLGDVLEEAGRDVRESGDELAEGAGELGDGVRRGARRMAGRADRAMNGPRVNLRDEIARRTLEMTKDSLARQEGRQFDMGYLSHQMLAHMRMLAAVEVAADHAGPELKTVLTDAKGHIEGHLGRARELAMRVDKMED